MSKDPASLSGLHDIVVPPPPGWWPLAPGWYVLGLLLLLGVLWLAYRAWRRYRCNRYRRAALAELRQIEGSTESDAILALPSLLKRTAMQAYTREQVAALSQENWLKFLELQCADASFQGESGELLLSLAYQPEQCDEVGRQKLIRSVRTWISRHRVETC